MSRSHSAVVLNFFCGKCPGVWWVEQNYVKGVQIVVLPCDKLAWWSLKKGVLGVVGQHLIESALKTNTLLFRSVRILVTTKGI